MKERKCLISFAEIDESSNKEYSDDLYRFIFDKMGELVKLMNNTFSKTLTDKRKNEIIEHFMNYSYRCKAKSLEETGADLCNWLFLFEMISLSDEKDKKETKIRMEAII